MSAASIRRSAGVKAVEFGVEAVVDLASLALANPDLLNLVPDGTHWSVSPLSLFDRIFNGQAGSGRNSAIVEAKVCFDYFPLVHEIAFERNEAPRKAARARYS